MGLFGFDDDVRLGLLAAGLGTLAGRGPQAIGQGGLLGLQAYTGAKSGRAQAAREDEERALKMELLRAQIQEMQSKQAAAQRAAQVTAERDAQIAAAGQPPEWAQNAGPLGALVRGPSDTDAAMGMARAGGDVKTMAELLKMQQPEYGMTLTAGVGPDGKPAFFQPSKRGGAQVVRGAAPPPPAPKMKLVTRADGSQVWVDENAVQAGTEYGPGMTPYQRASVSAEQAKASAERAKADAMRDVGGGQANIKVGELVRDLRKEYNSLPAIENYKIAVPIAESAKNAPDTPAGDLDLIYAVGKVLDPGSVVREGEMNLVIKSGSPVERFKGDVRMIVAGLGRLTPNRRKELNAMLAGRVKQLKTAHDAAAVPYRLQAKRMGLPETEIFGEQQAMSVDDLVKKYAP